MFPARQWGLVRALRVVPGVDDDERADGQYVPVEDLCCRLSLAQSTVLGRAQAVTRDLCGSTGLLWRRTDGGTPECVFTPGVLPNGSLREGLYELAWHNS